MVWLMGGKLERYFVPAIIGLAPLVLFLLNWDAERMSRPMLLLREFTVPVLAVEIATVAIALREGVIGAWRELRPPRLALVALGGLLAIAVTTAVVAPAPGPAMLRTVFWIVHLLFGFSIAFLCGRLFRESDLLAAYLLGFAAFLLAFAIFAAGAIDRPIHWTWELPSVTHIRHLGIYATPMVGICIGIMATRQRREIWAAAFLIAGCGFALALWTGSRGPVAAIGAALLAGLAFSPAMRRPRAWGGAALSLAAAAAAVAWLPVPASNMGALRTVAATTGSTDVTTGRLEMWSRVVGAIERRPAFGYGEGQMTTVAHFGAMAQPHNIVLQLLLAWGVTGLACALVLAFYFLRVALPALRKDEAAVLPPLLAMSALVVLSMLDAALYHVLPLSIFAACAGMIAAEWRAQTARQ